MIFETHAHYDDKMFDEDRESLLENMQEAGIGRIVNIGADLASTASSIALAEKYPFIYAAAGVHPSDAAQLNEHTFQWLSEQTAHEKVVAVGEIGLDYYWEKDEKMRELQRKAFIKQIELANKLNLPIVIHTREAIMDTLEILKQNPVDKKGVFHCCPQNRELIKEGLKLGFYISFAGPITFKSSKNAEEMINLVPDNRILIETDSPYLAPEPVRGTRNDCRNVKYIAEKIAKAKNISLEEVSKITMQNVRELFNI